MLDNILNRGVVLEPRNPVTHTEVTLQSNKIMLVRVTDDHNKVVAYQMKFIDPHLHRTIIVPLSIENMRDFHKDIGELLEMPE